MDVDEGNQDTPCWADECIDEEIKTLLAKYENGKQLPLDMVAHFEYFYNTLDCSYKVVNPFTLPNEYPALLFRDQSSNLSLGHMTVFEKHR